MNIFSKKLKTVDTRIPPFCRSIKKIPKIYLDDFWRDGLLLLKSRVQLTVWLFLTTFIIGNALGNILIFGEIRKQSIFTWGLLICVCMFVLFTIKKATTIYSARRCAFLLVVMIVGLVTRLFIVQNVPSFSLSSLYIILLFGLTFTLPWLPCDIIVLAVLHIGMFIFYFLKVPTYIYKNVPFTMEFFDLFQGIIILSIASLICWIVNKQEIERRIDLFILFKELQRKNKQMENELELATRVHNRLLPHSVNTRLADIAVSYIPMYYMGGDYAKFHFIDKNKLMFIICDVTGHGVSAALLVNAFNSEFERLVKENKEPGFLLKELDQFIMEDFAETSMYLTAFCGLLNYKTMKFTYSSYGHPPQYIYRAADSEIERVRAQTTFLGLQKEYTDIYQNELQFNERDQILLFTDGVIESINADKEEYGNQRLEAFIKNNQDIEADMFNKKLITELNSFSNHKFKDDVFLLNIRVK